MDVVRYFFEDFWHFVGLLIVISLIFRPWRSH